ncbi:MAG: CDP-diacylglycerol--glycerol-3-phosphate 3-phosphatidyltransferase [Gemmatimonadota bacterium]
MLRQSTLPNVITVTRIALTPVVMVLLFTPTFSARLLAFILFLVAAFSDLFDGHLARKYGWISDFGKLVDPIADKLLLVATFLPFYILSHRSPLPTKLPAIEVLPLWVLLVVLGREALVTLLRSIAARRGQVIPAGSAGKLKAVFQNIFIGTTILWYALRTAGAERGWHGLFWNAWQALHATVLLLTLGIAVVLTVWSLLVYLWGWRRGLRTVA